MASQEEEIQHWQDCYTGVLRRRFRWWGEEPLDFASLAPHAALCREPWRAVTELLEQDHQAVNQAALVFAEDGDPPPMSAAVNVHLRMRVEIARDLLRAAGRQSSGPLAAMLAAAVRGWPCRKLIAFLLVEGWYLLGYVAWTGADLAQQAAQQLSDIPRTTKIPPAASPESN